MRVHSFSSCGALSWIRDGNYELDKAVFGWWVKISGALPHYPHLCLAVTLAPSEFFNNIHGRLICCLIAMWDLRFHGLPVLHALCADTCFYFERDGLPRGYALSVGFIVPSFLPCGDLPATNP